MSATNKNVSRFSTPAKKFLTGDTFLLAFSQSNLQWDTAKRDFP
jgi:hypothetical protein